MLAPMPPSGHTFEKIIQLNKNEYGENYSSLRFLSQPEAKDAIAQRAALLSSLNDHVTFCFKGSKLDCSVLSQGCRCCGDGSWSCLFINQKCNCTCFYCPASQDTVSVPATNGIDFTTPEDYVGYLARFGFKGASISGGEPLLTLDTTLSYLEAIKARFGSGMYVWLYTNGTLLTDDIVMRLRDIGLDEIRFDIGATGYSLTNARRAVGKIPHVTVEIPAVPEEFEQLCQTIIEMKKSGLSYLNLHQLRLTPHNFKQLSKRPYTFVHGEKVAVLESELTALRILKYMDERKMYFPVNYCSMIYKHRYQRAGARRRAALQIRKSSEGVTENGYIRTISCTGSGGAIDRQIEIFRRNELDTSLWSVKSRSEALYIGEKTLHLIDCTGLCLYVEYHEAKMLPAVTYQNVFQTIKLNDTRDVVVERMKVSDSLRIPSGEIPWFTRLITTMQDQGCKGLSPEEKSRILQYESIQEGFAEYF